MTWPPPLSTYLLHHLNHPGDICSLILLPCFAVLIALSWIYLVKPSKPTSPPPPPGPPGLPLVGNLLFLDPQLHTYFARLGRDYGPVVKLRLGRKVGIVITSQSAAREVLKDKDIIFANRDNPATGLAATYGGSDLVSNPYGPEWRMLRKVCVMKMLSSHTLDSVAPLRRREIRRTVEYIYSQSWSSPVNVGEQIFLTTLNVLTNMMWGGSVEGAERARIGSEFRRLVGEITELLTTPNVSDFFPALARFDLQGLVKKMEGLIGKLESVLDEVIDRRLRLNGGEKSDDFLAFLLRLKDEGGEDSKIPFTDIHLRCLLMNMVIGGSDTSSSSLEFTMAEVINKPEVMKRAQQELDEVVGRDNIVQEAHIHKLPYLKAVMKESLRLHPVLPLMVPHSPSECTTVGGYSVPAGCQVFINLWAIHRDPSVWDDPLEFDPDRFMGWDSSGNTDDEFNYFPFGAGRRSCAGIAMAERMVLFMLATLLHSFDWRVPEGRTVEIKEKFGIVMKLKDPLVAISIPRLLDPALYQ